MHTQYHTPTTPQGGGGDSTTPQPDHRGGGGHYHTPTTPQEGEGDGTMSDPWPWPGRGWNAGRSWEAIFRLTHDFYLMKGGVRLDIT